MISEAARVRIYCELGELLGVENAAALVSLRMGPGTDLVTRSGLEVLESHIERRLTEIESRMGRRFDAIERRLTQIESSMNRRLAEIERRRR